MSREKEMDFNTVLQAESEIELKEEGVGADSLWHGYLYKDISIHVSPSLKFFYRTKLYDRLSQVPRCFSEIQVDQELRKYYTEEIIPTQDVINLLPERVQDYIIHNLDEFLHEN